MAMAGDEKLSKEQQKKIAEQTKAYNDAVARGDSAAAQAAHDAAQAIRGQSSSQLSSAEVNRINSNNKSSGSSGGSGSNKNTTPEPINYSNIWNDNYQKAQDAIARGDSVAAAAALSLMQEADKSKNGGLTSTNTYADLNNKINNLTKSSGNLTEEALKNTNKYDSSFLREHADTGDNYGINTVKVWDSATGNIYDGYSVNGVTYNQNGERINYGDKVYSAANDQWYEYTTGANTGIKTTNPLAEEEPPLKENPTIEEQLGMRDDELDQISPIQMQRALGFIDAQDWINNYLDRAAVLLSNQTNNLDRELAQRSRDISTQYEQTQRDQQIAAANQALAGGTEGARFNSIIQSLLNNSQALSNINQTGLENRQKLEEQYAENIANGIIDALTNYQNYGIQAASAANAENNTTGYYLEQLVNRLNGIDQANATARYYGSQSPTDPTASIVPEEEAGTLLNDWLSRIAVDAGKNLTSKEIAQILADRELGLIPGTGSNGSITYNDLKKYVKDKLGWDWWDWNGADGIYKNVNNDATETKGISHGGEGTSF